MTTTPRIGVYPGTFDPITNGHRDVISRASRLCDRLIIGVATNAGKGPLFTSEERVDMARNDLADLAERGDGGAEIEIQLFDSLLVDFATDVGASAIFRGLRVVSDFEYEFQMAAMNARLNVEVETVFLMASEQHLFVASRMVKEIARYGGDISTFVTPAVAHRVFDKLKRPGLHAVNE